MKTIEQKAEVYDKALEIAKSYYEEAIKLGKTASVEFLESMFDELRDNDEKIKKEIIDYIKAGTYRKEWIAWLEKQGEHHIVENNEMIKTSWSEEDIKAFNRISAILVDASEVKNWWKEYRLIEKDEMIRLTDFLKSLIPQKLIEKYCKED